MTISTFQITADTDDQRVGKLSAAYPPTGSLNRDSFAATQKTFSAGNYELGVGLLRWSTASIPDTDKVIWAKVSINVVSKVDTDGRSLALDWGPWDGSSASDYDEGALTNAHDSIPFSNIGFGWNDIFLSDPDSHVSKTGTTYVRLFTTGTSTPTGQNLLDIYAVAHGVPANTAILTVAHSPLGEIAHVGNDIAVDETTTNPSTVLNAAPATTDYGLALRRETEDIGMQPCSFSNFALAGANPETLASLTAVRNFVTGSAAPAHTVTTGKTMRITGFTGQAMRTTGTGGNPWYLRLNLRVNTGGTAVVTSPIAFSGQVGWTTDATTVAGFTTPSFYVDIPGGLDIPSGASFALGYENTGTQLTRVTNEVTVHGYEY